jgi:predicted ATPase
MPGPGEVPAQRPERIIGREAGLARLRGIVEPIPQASQVLLVTGEAGMGKTVLLADAAARQAGTTASRNRAVRSCRLVMRCSPPGDLHSDQQAFLPVRSTTSALASCEPPKSNSRFDARHGAEHQSPASLLPLFVADIAGSCRRARFSSTGSRQLSRRAW